MSKRGALLGENPHIKQNNGEPKVLLEVFLFLQITAFIVLIIGITTKRGVNDSEDRGNIWIMFVAAIIFAFLAFNSMDLDYKTCLNQVEWMNQSETNDTQITNTITCNDDKVRNSALAWLNGGMSILSFLLMIIFALLEFTKKPQTRPLA